MKPLKNYWCQTKDKNIDTVPCLAIAPNLDTVHNQKHHEVTRATHQKFLIDSGSVISVIPRTCIKQKLIPTSHKLFAANATVINTYGQRLMSLNLGLQCEYKWIFIIADVKAAIIGVDFIAHYGLLIDLKKHQLIDPLTSLKSTGDTRNI
ncbi:hypothetical protein KPH14_012024 [Odynerus spinipes]|uniref:Peptidase A2 domain-containing protein n=1 Tax=Odynerus spinipes TaxID=1348599 RepID=A0AAD9RF06_9HYME|nr:hypothetical protein KPH14_012024 [Odynerus spinipes]